MLTSAWVWLQIVGGLLRRDDTPVTDAVNAVSGTVGSIVNPVVSTVESTLDPVVGALRRDATPVTDAVNGVVGSVDSIADPVVSAVESVADPVSDLSKICFTIKMADRVYLYRLLVASSAVMTPLSLMPSTASLELLAVLLTPLSALSSLLLTP